MALIVGVVGVEYKSSYGKGSLHYLGSSEIQTHMENGGILGMVPLTINPRYTLYSGYLLGLNLLLKGLQQGGLNRSPPSQGYHHL